MSARLRTERLFRRKVRHPPGTMGASLSADGASLSGSNDFALGQMAKSVHFGKDELRNMQAAFMKIAADSPEAGSTVITLEQFGRALNTVEVPAGAGNFLGLLFNAFDKNGDGVLNYVEFCTGLSVIVAGARHTTLRATHTSLAAATLAAAIIAAAVAIVAAPASHPRNPHAHTHARVRRTSTPRHRQHAPRTLPYPNPRPTLTYPSLALR